MLQIQNIQWHIGNGPSIHIDHWWQKPWPVRTATWFLRTPNRSETTQESQESQASEAQGKYEFPPSLQTDPVFWLREHHMVSKWFINGYYMVNDGEWWCIMGIYGAFQWGYPNMDGFCERENSIKMDDWGVALFQEPPYTMHCSQFTCWNNCIKFVLFFALF